MRGISWLAENRLASQERLCSKQEVRTSQDSLIKVAGSSEIGLETLAQFYQIKWLTYRKT